MSRSLDYRQHFCETSRSAIFAKPSTNTAAYLLDEVQNNMTNITSSLDSNLWAYVQPLSDLSFTGETADEDAAPAECNASKGTTIRKTREQLPRACKNKTPTNSTMLKGLDMVFGNSNGKSHLFTFPNNYTAININSTLDNCDTIIDSLDVDSQYSRTTLEDCEHPCCYADSPTRALSNHIEDSTQFVPKEVPLELIQSPRDLLQRKCKQFFGKHNLVVKVRKLPAEGGLRRKIVSDKNSGPREILCYPAYHFISRQRRHMLEQLMRSRSFMITRYNSSKETRNFKSPFSLISIHGRMMEYAKSLCDDICDPQFSGIYISINTKAFESNSEFGRIKRSKTIAWALIELLTSNERCFRGLWVHPSITAPSTTKLLSALIPYTITASFSFSPNNLDESYPIKAFYAWLRDIDFFPRQALILLTSSERFGLIRHMDVCEDEIPYGASLSNEGKGEIFTGLCHIDSGLTDEPCYCYADADWGKHEDIVLLCTEGLVNKAIHRWTELVPESSYKPLLNDLSRLVLPEVVTYRNVRVKKPDKGVVKAEFTGLPQIHIKELLEHLYGHRWRNRLRIRIVQSIQKAASLKKGMKQQVHQKPEVSSTALASQANNGTHITPCHLPVEPNPRSPR
ncbi:hypothetical protein X943_002121 [Babesia divergens]|uniref:Uncharacterized protein n=1 Tax=Babesia divergens TaxID=32595 RepID=A0AAD9LGM6_BABDI|nr:hypothetical protein X943_002121 [Babesia divergens]